MNEFEIFRSKHNATHYVAIFADDHSHNAQGVRDSDNLTAYTRISDDDKTRIGFDPDAARAAIAEHGFYAFAVTVEKRDHFH
jgi:hypothetical protein